MDISLMLNFDVSNCVIGECSWYDILTNPLKKEILFVVLLQLFHIFRLTTHATALCNGRYL